MSSRVSIPSNVRKTIKDIKEITGKHSNEDIYAMLKECNMDPNETAQKLLYLDTFHEVRRKRDRKKVSVSSRASEEYGWARGVEWRGARSGRGNYSSAYVSDDSGGGRNVSARKENGVDNHTLRGSRPSMAMLHKTENNSKFRATKSSTVSINGMRSIPNGSSCHGAVPQMCAGNINGLLQDSSAVDVNKFGTVPTLPTVAVKQPRTSNPCPTPTSTPTTTSAYGPRARFHEAKSKSSSNHILPSASMSGVYSSASDPVLAPPLNSLKPGAVGTIKREIGSQRILPESGATLQAGGRSCIGLDVANSSQAVSGIANSNTRRPRKSQGVKKSQLSEPSQSSPLPTHNGSLAVSFNQDGQPPQQLNGPSKVVTSEPANVMVANLHSVPEVNDSVLEEATSKLDMKLEKLNISGHQHVIIPNHIQVPEVFKNGLTFGSLDATFGSKGSTPVAESVLGNNEIMREPPLSNQIVSSTAQAVDYTDHPQSSLHVPENISPLEGNVSASAVPKNDQSKEEIMSPLGGPQYPLLHTAPDYSFGLVPPLMGPHLVQFEGLELQSANSLVPSTSGSTPHATQPMGVGQSSIAVSPQMLPFFRQPYPPNYIPYGPYFPQLYLPQNAHQFLAHSGFAQQPSTGNIYVPPPAAASGVKFPVPPLYKPGTNAGSLTHFGIPTGYGSYSSSPVGYSPSAAVTPGSSIGNEDLAASELKEKNIYSTVPQGEDSHVWTPAPGRDISSLQANYFYNIPQGQHLAFSPAQAGHGALAGIYHPAQTVPAPSAAQPLPQQSQAMAGSVESVVPPSGAYQQPQSAQINWN